jgi:TPR repeat protein
MWHHYQPWRSTFELVPVETLIGELRRAKGLRIAILDACRDDNAERELKRVTARGGEIARGLGRVRNPEGLILAYATQYLSMAADGDPEGDSPFTKALLDRIPTPGLDVKDLFFRVGRDVITSTKGVQRPELSVSFYGPYTLVPAALGAAIAPPIPAPAPQIPGSSLPTALLNENQTIRLYRANAAQGDAAAQYNFVRSYKNGSGGPPKDDREAARLYKLAADQGNAFGQSNLGWFYQNGLGDLPKDDREAARLHKLVADHGNAQARRRSMSANLLSR